jgi:hypothetical protein
MKVDADFIRKWIDALRSGNYKQIQRALKRRGVIDGVVRYCCLGVACEIAGKRSTPFDFDGTYRFGSDDLNISSRFQKQIGLTDDDIDKLVFMNDSEYKSFKQIAAWLRRRFKKELAA